MKKTILVADDDPAVRRMLCRLLDGENYRVLPASDSQEALEVAHAARVDLILLDVDVALKSGWQKFQRICAENPAASVILISAQPHQNAPELGQGVGAIMQKPLDLRKLLRIIFDLLQQPMDLTKAIVPQ